MFGRIPKNLWQKWFPADDQNRILMAAHALKITSNGHSVLIDAGLGTRYEGKEADILGLSHKGAALGPVDDLILTHLHFDHAGGIQDLNLRGTAVVARRDWEAAHQEDPLTKGSYRASDLAVIARHLTLIDPPCAWGEHIEVLPSPGHTRGHVSIVVDDEIFFPGDLIPTAAHCHLPCIMAYDLSPQEIIMVKREFLGRAQSRGWLTVFEHDPYVPVGRISMINEKFKAVAARQDRETAM
jgi:glyoxylase-like metal-dependent hydrolase (beta-lactamase superfamily II)